MRRRTFLKLVAVTVPALAAPLSAPWTADAAARGIAYKDRLYRAGPPGTIMVSSNGGRTWKTHTYLGRFYKITRLAIDDRGRLRVLVGYGRRKFPLFLAPDGKWWRTV